jgi:CMP-N,N'-diacetyllegionaminic acid synthase
MSAAPSAVALIPARAGSKRVKAKNVRPLGGHPLIAYTIAAARASGVFGAVVVSTEDEATAAVARHYGAEVPFLRPAEHAADLSPDIDWIRHALTALQDAGRPFDAFALLRPTSPFRSAETIRRAWRQFLSRPGIDSQRAVELCAQHPGKMWVVEGDAMRPLLPEALKHAPPWHSTPYQALPKVHVQNASLEIAWTRVPLEKGTIAGDIVAPFLTEGVEGFDINSPLDWRAAEEMVAQGTAALPPVEQAVFSAL